MICMSDLPQVVGIRPNSARVQLQHAPCLLPGLIGWVMIAGLTLFSSLAPGDDVGAKFAVAPFSIRHPWARATLPNAAVGAAYFTIENPRNSDRLIGASTPVAKRVEFHSSRVESGMMQMRELPSVDIPRGGKVTFRPGALHAMLLDLNRPLTKGEHFPLTLVFEHAGAIPIDVVVRGLDEEDTRGL